MSPQKHLLAQQLDIIKNLPLGKTHPFTIEGAGILKAFINARAKVSTLSDAERTLHQKINRALSMWHDTKSESPKRNQGNTTENRHQMVLRNAIDKVNNKQFSSITEEDVNLLNATQALLAKRSDSGGHSNPHLSGVLNKALTALAANKDQMTNIQDASLFDEAAPEEESAEAIHNDLMASDIFGDIQFTKLNMIDDIEMEITARVYEFTGDTTITGDVPKDVMVKVREGELKVDGFVTGFLVADNDITVKGNIQGGGAISHTGSIVLERSLMNATLISKRGDITCEHIEAPRVCFAWGTLTVHGACMGGEICAGHITITGRVTAATLKSCGHIDVDTFTTSNRAKTVVLLDSTIDCAAYNREMDPKILAMVREINENGKIVQKALNLDSYTHHMIHTAYRTGLYYLFGGVDSATNAVEVQGLQTKVLYLSQIIGFAESYEKFYAEAYENRDCFDKQEIEDFIQDTSSAFTLVRDDIAAIPEDFGSSHRQYLQDRCAEYTYMTRKLKREYEVDEDTTFLKTDFIKLITQWHKTLDDTKKQAQQLIDSFGLDKEMLKRMEHEPETLEALLDDTIENILDSSKPDDVQRGRSPLLRLLKATANRLKRTIDVNHTKMVKARREINIAREQLLENYTVQFRDQAPGGCSLVGNHFAEDVIITASKLSRKGRDTNMAKVIVLSAPLEKRTEFHLWDKMVQRQAQPNS